MTALAMGANGQGQPAAAAATDEPNSRPCWYAPTQCPDQLQEPESGLSGIQDGATDTDVLVRTEVHQPGNKPVQLDYSLEKLEVAGRCMTWWWRASAWSPTIATSSDQEVRNGGIDGLIALDCQQEQVVGSEPEEMIEHRTGRLLVTAPLTMAKIARGLLEAGRSALQQGEVVFDFRR